MSRDYLLLPAVSLATLALMFAVTQVIAGMIFAVEQQDPCALRDPRMGGTHKPNCTGPVKILESSSAEESFNECGYRNPEPCGPKPSGTIRIALMGASVAEGYTIPNDKTFAYQVSRQLTQYSHRRVEIQNLAAVGCSPLFVCRRTNEALNLKPDLVLWVFSAYDIGEDIDPGLLERRDDLAPISIVSTPREHPNSLKKLRIELTDLRAVFAVQHFAFKIQTFTSAYI